MSYLKLAVLAMVLAACASPNSRIKRNRAAFDAYPPDVQQKIRDGKADVGFTQDQVSMALGRPERVYTRKTAESSQEVWAYGTAHRGGTSIGFGFGMGGGPIGYGVGVGTGGSDSVDDRVRVVFEGGKVVSLESRDR